MNKGGISIRIEEGIGGDCLMECGGNIKGGDGIEERYGIGDRNLWERLWLRLGVCRLLFLFWINKSEVESIV